MRLFSRTRPLAADVPRYLVRLVTHTPPANDPRRATTAPSGWSRALDQATLAALACQLRPPTPCTSSTSWIRRAGNAAAPTDRAAPAEGTRRLGLAHRRAGHRPGNARCAQRHSGAARAPERRRVQVNALLDTSVLVATFYGDHEHHTPSLEPEDIAACLRFASRRIDHPIVAA